jgi:hypothetical protein
MSIGNFCTIEPQPRSLIWHFRSKATGAIIITVREDVEQIFCTSQNNASIAVADLTASPAFATTQPEVAFLNRIVGAMIR